jgi:hypothetical protein
VSKGIVRGRVAGMVQTRLLSGDGLAHGQEDGASATCYARPSPDRRDPGDDPAVAVGARGISSMPLRVRGHTGVHTAARTRSAWGVG